MEKLNAKEIRNIEFLLRSENHDSIELGLMQCDVFGLDQMC